MRHPCCSPFFMCNEDFKFFREARFAKSMRRRQLWLNTNLGTHSQRAIIWRAFLVIVFILAFAYVRWQSSIHFLEDTGLPSLRRGIGLQELEQSLLYFPFLKALQPREKDKNIFEATLAPGPPGIADQAGQESENFSGDNLNLTSEKVPPVPPEKYISWQERFRSHREGQLSTLSTFLKNQNGETEACEDPGTISCSHAVDLQSRRRKWAKFAIPSPPADPEEDDYELSVLDDKHQHPQARRGSFSRLMTRKHGLRARLRRQQELKSEILAERRNNGGRITPRLQYLIDHGNVIGKSSKYSTTDNAWMALVARAKDNGTRIWRQFEEKGLSWRVPLLHQNVAVRPTLFIGIFSSPMHVTRRQACRDTWLQYPDVISGKVAFRFFVGLHRNLSIDEDLIAENKKHRDLEILPIMDSYYVIALKTLAIAHFVAQNSTATYVMKTDDDAFIRVDEVLQRLYSTNSTSGLLYGALVKNSRPVRNRRSKWYISREEWPPRRYPVWAHGAGYVFTSDVARYISSAYDAEELAMFRLEDIGMAIWIDGMVQKGFNITYIHDKEIVFDGCRPDYVIVHYQRPAMMLCLWHQLQGLNDTRCCQLQI